MKSAPMRYLLWCVVAVLVATMLPSCNPNKRNTAAARQYTAFITRYNIYYNGNTHFKETLEAMEDKYEDDYTQMLLMHPVEAKNDPKLPQPSGDFTRSIEKAQKAIQVRSIKKKPAKKAGKSADAEYKAWMAREEYNPFLHNAWMMMGRSQYFNGDFLGAASTFFYIQKHFKWLPETVTEAQIWQARSYISMGWLFEGEVILNRIKSDELTNKTLKGLYNFTYADYLVKSHDYEAAAPFLIEAIKSESGSQKSRLQFLLGQVYAELGDKEKAYKAFKDAGSSSELPYRTKFNARIKQSEVYTGSDITAEVKDLKKMLRYDRNKDYADQIYYAIGNLYLSRQDTTNAIANYRLAVEKSTRGGVEKAIAQITLGDLYFQRHRYDLAQPCFAEAVPLLPETYPDYTLLRRRSDVLDELAVYAENVTLQDSLLRLSQMTPEQQLAVVNKIIEELKKKEKEEAEAARREEYEAQRNQNQLQDNNQREFNINSDNSWYFYNTTTRNSGKTEFQKRWGSRKLEDDWRRRNKTTFNVSDFDADSGDDDEKADSGPDDDAAEDAPAEDQQAADAASDPHNPEYYLQQIPKTDEERATSNEIIQEGLYNMGVILKDKLDDYSAAMAEFDELERRYPDNTYRLDVYYNIYLMAMRAGKTAEAEKYRQKILADFPDSKYGQALRDPNYIDNLRRMDQRQQELYDQAYDAYLNNRNDEVHRTYEQIEQEFPLSKIMPKFMFLHALAYVTENNTQEFNSTLRQLLERYPTTDLTPLASAWLKGMASGRELHATADGTNMRGMLWDIHLTNDSTFAASDSIPAFEFDVDEPHMLVLVFPTDEISGNELLYEVARHNFSSYMVRDFDLEMMNFGRLGMLVIRGFENQDDLNRYRRMMNANPDLKLPPEVNPIPISVKNFETLLHQGRTFDDYFRALEEGSIDYEDTE